MPDLNRGYWLAENREIPYNDREKGHVAPIALQYLKQWQEIADSWPLFKMDRGWRCRLCGQNIWYDYDEQGVPYQYEYGTHRALLVAHIRQNHEGINDRDKLAEVLSRAGYDDTGSVYSGDDYRPEYQGVDHRPVESA
jgi:hypothetical protein